MDDHDEYYAAKQIRADEMLSAVAWIWAALIIVGLAAGVQALWGML